MRRAAAPVLRGRRLDDGHPEADQSLIFGIDVVDFELDRAAARARPGQGAGGHLLLALSTEDRQLGPVLADPIEVDPPVIVATRLHLQQLHVEGAQSADVG